MGSERDETKKADMWRFHSMTAVLTTTMTLRVILSVKGSLAQGGTYTGMSSMHTHSSNIASSRQKDAAVAPHSSNTIGNNPRHSISQNRSANHQTYTIEEMRAKAERDWTAEVDDVDAKYVIDDVDDVDDAASSKKYEKGMSLAGNDDDSAVNSPPPPPAVRSKGPGGIGVKVTIDREFQ